MTRDKSEAPWRVLGSDLVHDGGPRILVDHNSLFTGTGRRVDDFHSVEAKDLCLVFARTAGGRISVECQGPQRFALSFPAGHVEPGEDPAQTVLRELTEESGCTAPTVQPLGRFCRLSNLTVGWGTFFLAEGEFPAPCRPIPTWRPPSCAF